MKGKLLLLSFMVMERAELRDAACETKAFATATSTRKKASILCILVKCYVSTRPLQDAHATIYAFNLQARGGATKGENFAIS